MPKNHSGNGVESSDLEQAQGGIASQCQTGRSEKNQSKDPALPGEVQEQTPIDAAGSLPAAHPAQDEPISPTGMAPEEPERQQAQTEIQDAGEPVPGRTGSIDGSAGVPAPESVPEADTAKDGPLGLGESGSGDPDRSASDSSSLEARAPGKEQDRSAMLVDESLPGELETETPPVSLEPEVVPTASVELEGVPPVRVEPEDAPPVRVEPEDAPPASVEPEAAPPVSVEPEDAPPASVEPEAAPPVSVEPEVVPTTSVEPEDAPPARVELKVALPASTELARVDAPGPTAGLVREIKRRRRLLITLVGLLIVFVFISLTFWRYLRQPAPLPDLLPIRVEVNYPPHYLFSIYGVDKPVGVAWSSFNDRVYVTETGGERLVKMLARDGNLLASFSPPHTRPAERSPVYLAVDQKGRVFVPDRLQHTVFVYSPEGTLLDAILSPDLALSEYISERATEFQPASLLAYNAFEALVYYLQPGPGEQTLPLQSAGDWAPLGVRVDGDGGLLLTDVLSEHHLVRQFPGEVLAAASWQGFDPPEITFGTFGPGPAELAYPNVAVTDSLNRIYVTDGNNGRISVWDRSGAFLFSFGRGVGEGALSLPRGAAMDSRDRLHVVDAVEQKIKVYDVAGSEPEFLFAFGNWGDGDAEFNFPNDITLDASGRLYIADRENNRIQVWTY